MLNQVFKCSVWESLTPVCDRATCQWKSLWQRRYAGFGLPAIDPARMRYHIGDRWAESLPDEEEL